MQNLCMPKINKTTSTCNSFLVNSPLKVWPKRYIYKTKLQFCLLQCFNFKMTDRLSKLTSSDSVEWQSLLREIKIRPTHTDTETEGYRRHLQTTDRHQTSCMQKTRTTQQIRNYCKLENASDEHIRHTHINTLLLPCLTVPWGQKHPSTQERALQRGSETEGVPGHAGEQAGPQAS